MVMGSCGGRQKTKEEVFRTVVISGPSGSGKSTLVKRLMQEHSDCFAYCISHTTRPPRQGEVDGKAYHFVTMDEMMRLIEAGKFIEHAKFSGHLYGTSKRAVEEVMNSGLICLMDIDMMGVKSLKKTNIRARYIFVKAESLSVLENRLRERGTEQESAISQRLANAVAELEYAETPGSYDYVIVNDDLNQAYVEVESILAADIADAKRRRTSQQKKKS